MPRTRSRGRRGIVPRADRPGRGEIQQDLGAADEQQRQVGRSIGRKVEQQPECLEGRWLVDRTGPHRRPGAGDGPGRPSRQAVRATAARTHETRNARRAGRRTLRPGRPPGRRRAGPGRSRAPSARPSWLASRRASSVLPEPGGPNSTAGPRPCSSAYRSRRNTPSWLGKAT